MNIRHYISFFIKNVIKMLTLLIGVSIAAFMLVSLSPIDPVQANVGATAYMRMTPEKGCPAGRALSELGEGFCAGGYGHFAEI